MHAEAEKKRTIGFLFSCCPGTLQAAESDDVTTHRGLPRAPLDKQTPKKKAPPVSRRGFHNSGSVLLSHSASAAVPSALTGLTSEFGMGSGVTLSTLPPNP